ncbi:hypothetical protein Tco_0271039 [Tanacetum coccineum]
MSVQIEHWTNGFTYGDCKVLTEKVKNRIQDRKNKSLSFAGRLQLIISVLINASVLVNDVHSPGVGYKRDGKVDEGFSLVPRGDDARES